MFKNLPTFKTVTKFVISGTITGCVFDHFLESKNEYVNHGHRMNNGGNSVYDVIGDMTIFPLTAFIVLPFMVWIIPGIYVNQKIDKLLYPDRWIISYKSDTYREYIELLNSMPKCGGSGNPQMSDFF